MILNKTQDELEVNEKTNGKMIGFDTTLEIKPVLESQPVEGLISTQEAPTLFKSPEIPFIYATEKDLKSLDTGSDSFFGRSKRRLKTVPNFESMGTTQLMIYLQIFVPLVSHVFGFQKFMSMVGFNHWITFLPATILSLGFEFYTYYRTVVLEPTKLESFTYKALSTAFSVLAWEKFYNTPTGIRYEYLILAIAIYYALATQLHATCLKLKDIIQKNKELNEIKRQEREKERIANPEVYKAKYEREKKLTKEDKQSILNYILANLSTGVSIANIIDAYGIKESTAHKFLNQAEILYNKKRESLSKEKISLPPPKRIYSKRKRKTVNNELNPDKTPTVQDSKEAKKELKNRKNSEEANNGSN